MSDVILKLLANGSEQVEQLGEYIAIKESNVALDIHINGVGSMKMSKGEVWRIRGGFESFTIENYDAIAADVLLAVGFGDYRAALSVGNLDKINTIVNPIDVNPHDVNNVLNPVAIKKREIKGTSFVSHAGGVITLVMPSSNIYGILVHSAIIAEWGIVGSSIVADTVAPISWGSGNGHRLLSTAGNGIQLSNEVEIAAGLGLYVVITSNTYTHVCVSYEVL